VLADIPQYDTGIELAQARGTRVLHNTLVETAAATGSFSSLDYRWANTRVELTNNLTRRITTRDGGEAVLSHNVESTPQDWLVDPLRGDFHLRPGQNGAQDRGVGVAEAGLDIDGRARDHGAAPDIGADEWSPADPSANPEAGGPRQARLRLKLAGVRRVRGRYIARRGHAIRVTGTLTPYVARQKFTVSFRRGRRVRRVSVRTKRFERSRKGGFVVAHKPRRRGWVTIRAGHRRSAALDSVRSRRLRVLVR